MLHCRADILESRRFILPLLGFVVGLEILQHKLVVGLYARIQAVLRGLKVLE
jgi:hypothetical protein